jgi:hypothetical protein
LTVPRTWEYTAVAAALHNQTYEGKVLTGSCMDEASDVPERNTNLVISSSHKRTVPVQAFVRYG